MSSNVETAQRFLTYRLANKRTSCMALVSNDVIVDNGQTVIVGKDALLEFLKKHTLTGEWKIPQIDEAGNVVVMGNRRIGGEKLEHQMKFEFDEFGKIRKISAGQLPGQQGGSRARSSLPSISGARSSMTKAFSMLSNARRSTEMVYEKPRSQKLVDDERGARTSERARRASMTDCGATAKPKLDRTPRASGSPKALRGCLTVHDPDKVAAIDEGIGHGEYDEAFIEEAVVTAQRFMKYRLASHNTGCLALVTSDVVLRTGMGGEEIKGIDALREFLATTTPSGVWDTVRFDPAKGKIFTPGTFKRGASRTEAQCIFEFDSHGKLSRISVVVGKA